MMHHVPRVHEKGRASQAAEQLSRRAGCGKGTASSRAAINPKELTARLKAVPFTQPERRCKTLSAVVGFTLLALAGCRQDMHDQPRFKPLAMSDFYSDQRSARPPVEGTVARGQLHEDAYFYTGKISNNPGDYLPFAVSDDVLARGRERFDIYCAPCHSRLGDGNGMIVQRGFRRPPSYHIERLRKAPLGYFFDVMTNGFGAMPEYASQITPRDRWCIVAYIRALQLSQNATSEDLPPGQKVPSEPPVFRGDPGSGASLPELQPATAGGKAEEPK